MTQPESVKLDCGKTIDEISDYLAADRTPYDPEIETCPECLNALDSLERAGRLAYDLVAHDAAQLPPPPEGWFGRIMDVVRSEVRAGRSLPVQHPDPRMHISITEGAVRSLVRAAGDEIDGLFVGRVALDGDAEVAGAPVRVVLTATVAWDRATADLISELRESVVRTLAQHTDLNVAAVDITVDDVHGWDEPKGSP